MDASAERWDARYRSEGYPAGTEPAAFLRQILRMLPRGHALDLATGAGRNAVFLAANGHRVLAVDASRTALEKAGALAEERGVAAHWLASREASFAPKAVGLWLLEADLERSVLPDAQYELAICFNYLQRSLFPVIERALRPGGVLVYETYTLEQLAFPHGPRKPEYLLRPGELRESFPHLETLFYRELRAGKGIASLIARKR
jgi:SAM-dependent methyltransferase